MMRPQCKPHISLLSHAATGAPWWKCVSIIDGVHIKGYGTSLITAYKNCLKSFQLYEEHDEERDEDSGAIKTASSTFVSYPYGNSE